MDKDLIARAVPVVISTVASAAVGILSIRNEMLKRKNMTAEHSATMEGIIVSNTEKVERYEEWRSHLESKNQTIKTIQENS